jgi:hypothetical protein
MSEWLQANHFNFTSRMKQIALVLCLFLMPMQSLHAQLVNDMDESRLYAQTKQVNQFFRRFNGEEDEKGERYYPKDKQYRSIKLRKKYLGILFDASNTGISSELKTKFGKDVLEKTEPAILDFHGPDWFCEVSTTFTLQGREQPITLFMELEKAQLGYKWVISNVYADVFAKSFKRDTTKVGKFLHPLSHELDFMNLHKAFSNTDSISQYAVRRFVPDQLTLFLNEVQKENLKFKTVNEIKFHFFQVKGWYFELANFNRSGYNTGWLISNLVELKTPQDTEVMKRFLYEGK